MTEVPHRQPHHPRPDPTKSHRRESSRGGLVFPALILAADHRPRAVPTIENYHDYVSALAAALPHCDGILATPEPLGDLADMGALTDRHRTYLSLNRTGLSGSVFELDDRLVTSVERARADGWTGIKHMTRIDMGNPLTSPALELLGQVMDAAAGMGLDALIECVGWRPAEGRMARDTDTIVQCVVIAHDMGAPLLKAPVPDEPAGAVRAAAVARVMASVGSPVLFLGGPSGGNPDDVLAEVRDVMDGGGSGLAIGRTVIQHADPAGMAARLAEIVHR